MKYFVIALVAVGMMSATATFAGSACSTMKKAVKKECSIEKKETCDLAKKDKESCEKVKKDCKMDNK